MDSPGKPGPASPPSYEGLHRRQKAPLFAGVSPRPPFRVPPTDDLDPIESTGYENMDHSRISHAKNGFLQQLFVQEIGTTLQADIPAYQDSKRADKVCNTVLGSTGSTNTVSDLYTQSPGPATIAPPTASPVDDSMPTTLTKTPTYEYYGFVLYLVSGITYVMYLAWAYLPKEMLDSLGITYYPSKYWALALPIWLFVLIIYLYIVFFAVNLYNTASFDSFHTITDEHANPLETTSSAALTDDFVPDLMDIPIGLVNAALYQHIEGISDDEDEMDDDLGYHWSVGGGVAGLRSGDEDTLMVRTADGIEVEIDDDELEFDVDDEDDDDDEGLEDGDEMEEMDDEHVGDDEEEDDEDEDEDDEEEDEGFRLDGTNLSDWDDFAHP
ncbi:hypothetical protein BGZ73_004638 [Actinomortierella ambigua]|nr:hypothetical protein BGZ73_004638 [Actinomortierella ambigua]